MIKQDTGAFLTWLKTQIPLLNHMGIDRFAQTETDFSLAAALAPNINDKGTGFGGSIATLATITGWSYTTLLLRDMDLDCDVMIRDSEMRYTAPVQGDFIAKVVVPSVEQVDTFLSRMHKLGKGRLSLTISVLEGDKVAFEMQATYVAVKRLPL